MTPDYARKLGLKVWKTHIGAKEIDGPALETYKKKIAEFQMKDKDGRFEYF